MTIDTYMHNTSLDVTNLISLLKMAKKIPQNHFFFFPIFWISFCQGVKNFPKKKKKKMPVKQ